MTTNTLHDIAYSIMTNAVEEDLIPWAVNVDYQRELDDGELITELSFEAGDNLGNPVEPRIVYVVNSYNIARALKGLVENEKMPASVRINAGRMFLDGEYDEEGYESLIIQHAVFGELRY